MNTWIFQGNPDRFDLDTYLTRARQILWLVRQKHLASQMKVGDRMFLWKASGHSKTPSGIVASGWLVEAPKVQPDDKWSRDLWKGPVKAGDALRVRVDIDRVAPGSKEIIHADWLKDDPVCKGLRILKFHSETNYLVSPAEARRLEALWKNTGRDWTRPESIAGLWAYHQTSGGPVSRSPGSPIAIIADRIGRAMTGVYNKVMNFRAIDPRDTRAGLVAGSQIDRSVWEEFYDPETKTLRSADLERSFEQLWPETGSLPLDVVSIEDMVSTASGRRGQGFISDPAARRAVELRAMALAKEHYSRLFARVEDTSATRPFDLRCIDHDGVETRVEVKGGTSNLDEVRVTAGEVDNARGTQWSTDLFLVSNIEISSSPSGFQASAGEVRLITGWRPQAQDLKPLAFTCRLPDTIDPRGPKGK